MVPHLLLILINNYSLDITWFKYFTSDVSIPEEKK